MSNEPTPGYYMIRAMDQSDAAFEVFFGKDVVAVGWSEIPFNDYQHEHEIVHAVEQIYYSDGQVDPRVVGKKKNEVRRFLSIQEGDRILVPRYNTVCLAYALSDLRYDPSARNYPDLSNQRPVTYVLEDDGETRLTIPRNELTEGLQRRLRVRGSTVTDLIEFRDEIEKLFKGQRRHSIQTNAQEQLTQTFKKQLLDRLTNGKTHLQAGGVGLEQFVEELLKLDGFEAEVLSKRSFQGFADADIVASRSHPLANVQLLIQVKHHRDTSGSWGAQQLLAIRREHADLWQEYDLVLITTAQASEELTNVCQENNIKLIDGEALVDWIYDVLPNLSDPFRRDLGISDTPQFLS